MPDLIKLYIRQSIIGFAIAGAFVAMLLYFNVQNLWSLVSSSEAGILAVFLLWFMNGIVFAGVQFAWAVMSMADRKDRPRGGTPVAHDFEPIPVRAAATSRRHVRARR
jgi:hypothetical protein